MNMARIILLVMMLLAAAPASGALDDASAKQAAKKAVAKPKIDAAKKPEAKPAKPEAKPAKPEAKAVKPPAGAKTPVSFLHEVAPILVENCIACHNPRKSESKYVMTSFDQLAKGGRQGEGMTLIHGKPDESYLIEVVRPDANPRMPYKLDPLPAEKIALLERWVAEGGKYDGGSPGEDWTIVMHKVERVSIPEVYPATLPVTALAFSPDGSTVAAAGFHELTFWNAATGALAGRRDGQAERIYRIAYSPDGKWLAVASGDPGIYGVARLFRVEPGGKLMPARDLVETQDVVFAVAFSPDSKTVAAAGADRTIRLVEVETGKLAFQVEDHADWVLDVAFSPDGKRLASASRDKTAKVFDIVKKESLVTFPGHAQPVYAVLFTPDGKSVASGGEDARVRYWNPDADGKQIRAIEGFGGSVFALRFTPDGKNLLAAGADKTVRVFTDKGSSVRKLEGHADWIYSLAVSADGKTVASGSWDGQVRLWNLADGKFLRAFTAAPGYKPPGPNGAG